MFKILVLKDSKVLGWYNWLAPSIPGAFKDADVFSIEDMALRAAANAKENAHKWVPTLEADYLIVPLLDTPDGRVQATIILSDSIGGRYQVVPMIVTSQMSVIQFRKDIWVMMSQYGYDQATLSFDRENISLNTKPL